MTEMTPQRFRRLPFYAQQYIKTLEESTSRATWEADRFRNLMQKIFDRSSVGPYAPPRRNEGVDESRWYNLLVGVSELARQALSELPK